MSTTEQTLSLDADEAEAVRRYANRGTWHLLDGHDYDDDPERMLADAQALMHAAMLHAAADAGQLPAEYLPGLAAAIHDRLADVLETLYGGGLDAEYREQLKAAERGFLSLADRLDIYVGERVQA